MKTTTLLKLVKILRATRVAIPLAILLLGFIARVQLFGEGDPNGDPIEDDPVPS